MTARADTASADPDAGPAITLDSFRQAVAEDLLSLALLHHAEPSGTLLQSLRQEGGLSLGLALQSAVGREALQAMAAAFEGLPETFSQTILDQYAADYTDIYLTNGYGASPHESVWLDEDHLMRQEPMFQVRAYYTRHGLTVGDWRTRPEDHLALELQFLAHLFEPVRGDTLAEAARFMDEHLLRWLPPFSQRVAERCRTRFFAALALLTAAYCEELRELLAQVLAEPRPTPEEIEQRMQPKRGVAQAPSTFIPGQGPTW